MSIAGELKAAEVNTYNVKEKLNVWFSLYNHFIHSPKQYQNMVNHLESLRKFTAELVERDSNVHLKTDKEFAFVSGQLIRYLFSKISSDKQAHNHLERFVKAQNAEQLKQELSKWFIRYKHERFSNNFQRAMSQVLATETTEFKQDFIPFLLAGYFSDSVLFSNQNKEA